MNFLSDVSFRYFTEQSLNNVKFLKIIFCFVCTLCFLPFFIVYQAEKKAHHNALERRRRDHIKESFLKLRDAIPDTKKEKVFSWMVFLLVELNKEIVSVYACRHF